MNLCEFVRKECKDSPQVAAVSQYLSNGAALKIISGSESARSLVRNCIRNNGDNYYPPNETSLVAAIVDLSSLGLIAYADDEFGKTYCQLPSYFDHERLVPELMKYLDSLESH